MLGEAAARVVIEVVVGFRARGSDLLLVDERVDQERIALVGIRAVGEALSRLARQGFGERRVAFHIRADLLHQSRLVESASANVSHSRVVPWLRERQTRGGHRRGNLSAGAARTLRWLGRLLASLQEEKSGTGQNHKEEDDMPSTPHVGGLVILARAGGRGMNSGHGCHMRRVGAVGVVREKLVGTRTGRADAI